MEEKWLEVQGLLDLRQPLRWCDGAGLANDVAGCSIERRVQRHRAVAVILEAVLFGPARGQTGCCIGCLNAQLKLLFSEFLLV